MYFSVELGQNIVQSYTNSKEQGAGRDKDFWILRRSNETLLVGRRDIHVYPCNWKL